MIEQLRSQFPVTFLLKVAKISRSTFYHQRSHKKDPKIMKHIKEIFNQHHGNYGYRRIMVVLRNKEIVINHKKVMGLFVKSIRKRNRYSSYKGTIDKVTGNEINWHFTIKEGLYQRY